METSEDTAATSAALHAAMNTPATTSEIPHLAAAAEMSQASELPVPAVADAPRWPEPADPANPGGGIKD